MTHTIACPHCHGARFFADGSSCVTCLGHGRLIETRRPESHRVEIALLILLGLALVVLPATLSRVGSAPQCEGPCRFERGR